MSEPDVRHQDDWLSAYLDGELTPAARAEAERRLADDPAARRRLDELGRMTRELNALPRQALPDDFSAQVHARIERESPTRQRSGRSWRSRRLLRPLGIAAAIGLTVLGWLQYRDHPRSQSPQTTLLVDAGTTGEGRMGGIPLDASPKAPHAEAASPQPALKSLGYAESDAPRYKEGDAKGRYRVAAEEEARKSVPAPTAPTGAVNKPLQVADALERAQGGRASEGPVSSVASALIQPVDEADRAGVDTTLAMRIERFGQDAASGDVGVTLKKAGKSGDAVNGDFERSEAEEDDSARPDAEVARRLLAVATLDQKLAAGVQEPSLHKHWFGNEPRQMVLAATDTAALDRVGAVLASVSSDDSLRAEPGGFVGGARFAWKGAPGGNFEPMDGESQWVVRLPRTEWPGLLERLSEAGGEQVRAELISGDLVLSGWAAAQAVITPEDPSDAHEWLVLGYPVTPTPPDALRETSRVDFDEGSVASRESSSAGGAVTPEQAIEDLVSMLGRSAVARRELGADEADGELKGESAAQAKLAAADTRTGGNEKAANERGVEAGRGRIEMRAAPARPNGQPSEAKPAPASGAIARGQIEEESKGDANKDKAPASSRELAPKPGLAEERRKTGAVEGERVAAKSKDGEDASAHSVGKDVALGEAARVPSGGESAPSGATVQSGAPAAGAAGFDSRAVDHESLAARRLRAARRDPVERPVDTERPDQARKTIQPLDHAGEEIAYARLPSTTSPPLSMTGAPTNPPAADAHIAGDRLGFQPPTASEWVTVVVRLRIVAPPAATAPPSKSDGESAPSRAPTPPSSAPPEHAPPEHAPSEQAPQY